MRDGADRRREVVPVPALVTPSGPVVGVAPINVEEGAVRNAVEQGCIQAPDIAYGGVDLVARQEVPILPRASAMESTGLRV